MLRSINARHTVAGVIMVALILLVTSFASPIQQKQIAIAQNQGKAIQQSDTATIDKNKSIVKGVY